MTRTLHMIGNAHIDPVWLWQWPEGYQEVRATFRSALDRLRENDDFVFTHTSVLFLEWVEESDPEMFAEIRERIAEGRWQVVGGWWIEPDCNIPAGESFVRQGLYGQRWLLDRFGIVATTGANLDSFGHNASLPQILAKSGMDSYVFLRPKPDENPHVPAPLFRWEAADGSSVLAYRIPHEYCAPRDDLGDHVEKSLATLPDDLDELAVFYGVGNHGGGPTQANLRSIAELNERGDGTRLELSSLRAFFDAVADDPVPTWRGDLQYHAPGCYTTHSGIKRWNRRAENLLQRAEKWAAIADALGAQPYPLAQLSKAWQLLLFNQFHDTLAGTSIEPAYEDARDQVGHASSIAGLAFNRAVQSIARQIDIPFEESTFPVVVFNPHPWRLRTDVELEYNWLKPEGVSLADGVPLQQTRSLTTMSANRARLVFPADVPPLGYRVYRIVPGAVEAADAVRATDTSLENDHVLLEIDRSTGRIRRLVHKASGADLAAPGRPHASVVADVSDTWGHEVRAYDDVIGEFECTSVELVENGPVRAMLRVESRYGRSVLREDYALGADAPYVDVNVVVDWHQELELLKLRYPTSVTDARATFEAPYGHLERETDGHEDPGQTWVDVSGDGRGLAVINDAKSGYDVLGADLGVSVVRSPVWAWHDPRELEPDGDFEYMDQGRQRFRIRLVPHAGDWREAGVVRLAAELNQPAYAMLESFHDGPLPPARSYADGGDGPVVFTVLKAAEDGGGYVLRGYETAGRDAHATVALPLLDRTLELDFGANEIKTVFVPRDPAEPARETNLLER
ncbi:MAG TPA: glycoside hydrolase family 38 C-terminal domain-containing protein [Gaiellaceae bacterium]|nr:glycoside hydrolase family 38 C-terminal domain-containing protein [Gaiellaceae bacterium]